MTPTPQEYSKSEQEVIGEVRDGERIVISGMSGLYPKSHNIKELSDMLYDKRSPISEDNSRWKFIHPEVSKYAGNIPELQRFDAQFFKVHYRLGNCIDPMGRKLLEQSYNAIYDAGINPESLSGQKIGVFIGSCFSETDKSCFYDTSSTSGFGITGCCRAMFAHRISYWLNAKGPSMTLDESCCSSAAALEQAYLAITEGHCVAAIVGASCLCLHPQSSIHYSRIMKHSNDGKIRSFDANGSGPVKSETINVLFLQKAKDALRVYSDVVHVKTQYIGLLQGETGPMFGFLRDHDATVNFMKKFYEEAKVPPRAIEYVEAYGCAIPEVDKAELEAIDKVFCEKKESPLLVGSVMSNIGYVESGTSIAGVTKVLLGFHTGKLASNLHCENPRQDVEAIRDGRIKIVTEHEDCSYSYAAINGYSISGANSHILLQGHYKPKDLSRYKSDIPHLVTISARQDTTVQKIFENFKSRDIDPEELALWRNIHGSSISGHLGRGFVILDTNEEQKTVSRAERAEYFDGARRPLWFVYSGMGSQWAGMGTQLMRIPIFAAAIEKCRQTLEPKGIDIVHIITSNDDKIFDNILNSFVGIAATQIGLTDVLHELGLVPDGIIGHSVGELGCAYADGCLTAEEMILSAYSRGLVSLQTPFIRGSMAAVGLGYETISTMIPPEIEVACHNARESSTISGPADIVREFVAEITSKGIFAKEVPCSNIAYHSRYIADAGPGLLKYLKEVIKTARPRSNRWVSTSVPKENWNEHLAQYSSAEYHTNNLLCPVLFEETLPEIPNNAVLVEVAPHGLLQAILKRSVPSDCKNIALTRRKHPDNVFLLLESIGKLYMEGYNPKVQILYPKIELPVSTGTPFLSHHVEWAHGEKWAMPFYKTAIRVTAAASNCMVSLHDKENQYLNGHIIEERVVYPYAASLIAVWDTFAMYNNILKKQLSVVFQDVQFHVQPHIQDQSQMTLKVEIQKGTGKFNVLDDNIKIASGCIVIYKKKKGDDTENKPTPMIHANSDLNEKDIYDLLLERNHSYSGEFRSLQRANASLTEAELIWHNNWTTFIDGMLQLNVLRQPHTLVLKPVYIKQISIDVENHKNFIGEEKLDDKVLVKAEVHDQYGYTKCGGIFIEGIRYKAHYPCTLNNEINLGSLQFVQKDDKDIDVAASLLVFLQIMAENLDKQNINIIGVTDYIKEGSIFDALNINDANFIGINVQYQQLPISSLKNSNLINMADAVMVNNLPTDDNICSNLHRLLREDTFVITENDDALDKRTRPSALYRVLSTLSDNRNGQTQLQLVRWKPVPQAPIATAITIRTPSDYALLSSARASIPPKQRLLIFSPYPAPAGLKDVVQAWRKESNRNLIQLVMVSDEGSNLFIDELPEIDLALNVVIQGKWGGEYYVPIKDDTKVSNVMLKTSQVGDYNNLIWTESPDVISDALTVNVHYAAINSVDIKKASGSYIFKKESDNCFGMDFSGVTTSGNRVMGVIPGGAICSQLRLEPEMLWPVPAHWSLEEAATVPLPYLLALYCLGVKTIIVPGLSVLIHGGCGAIGQAAIATALYLRCKVFTTVSDIRKKKFLLDLFPELEECYIGNSRDDSFGDLVLAETGGRGCDVVISNVKPDLKDVSCKCVASSGFIIDLQYFDGEENDSFGLYYLTKERSYSHIQFSSIFKKENQNQFRILHGMLAEGIHRGYVRPLSHITYKSSEVSRAFKLLAASNHRGRVLLHIKDDTPHVSKHRFTCKADQCHLILSNEENLGIQLADRLIERGVSKLHIHCMAYSSAKAQYKIRSWQKANVEVRVSFNNLNTENDVQKLIDSAKLLGPVQGIFSVVGATQKLHESLFKALDLISRKQCPDLRYFAIIHLGNSMSGHTTCISRVNNKLPATLLSLPDLKDVYNPIWRGSLDAIERAVVVPKPVLIARIIPEENQELINQIADISGISLPKDVSMTATLEQLGCLEDRLQSISTFLRVKYNADFNEHQLLHLTLEEILHVERTDHTLEDVKGLGKFFGQVDPDNLQATTQMVFMPTITTGSLMRENEFDMNQTFLSIIPGMEGLYARFFGICERLKLSALVLQPSLDHPNDTIYETARKFTESLMASSAVKNNFYLLGYESGIFIALEMAKILEEYGLTGTVYCIGYAPNELKATIEETLAEYKTKEELQNAVAHHMCTLMTDMDTTSLMKSLQKVTTWPKKLNVCKSFLRGHITHSLQYAVSIIDCALAHIEQARQYITSPYNLRSRLILLRAAHTEPPKFEASLQQYSQQPVIIHQLQAPLARVAKDARCAAIINQYLDPQILDAFEKKNVCDSYLLDPDNFMSIQHDYESVE